MAFTFEIQNSIHHMLQDTRPCNLAFFCYVAHEENGNILRFCNPHQFGRTFPNLCHTAWRRSHFRVVNRLNRIDNDKIRSYIFNGMMNQFKIRFCINEQL